MKKNHPTTTETAGKCFKKCKRYLERTPQQESGTLLSQILCKSNPKLFSIHLWNNATSIFSRVLVPFSKTLLFLFTLRISDGLFCLACEPLAAVQTICVLSADVWPFLNFLHVLLYPIWLEGPVLDSSWCCTCLQPYRLAFQVIISMIMRSYEVARQTRQLHFNQSLPGIPVVRTLFLRRIFCSGLREGLGWRLAFPTTRGMDWLLTTVNPCSMLFTPPIRPIPRP